MVDIDYRIELLGNYLNKVQKQVEECNPAPLTEHDSRKIEKGLLNNYAIAGLHINELGKDLYNRRPGIFAGTAEKQRTKIQEEYYETSRSRYEKLEKDFIKDCVCTRAL